MTDRTCCSCATLKAAHRLACEAVEVGKRDLRLLADRLDTAIAERDRATAWLATVTGLPYDEAARVIRKLSTTTGIPENEAASVIRKLATAVGDHQVVRILDAILDDAWQGRTDRPVRLEVQDERLVPQEGDTP